MRKVRFWELWDWKSIFGVISIFLLIISVFLFSEFGLSFSQENKLKGKTIIVEGQLDSIKPIFRMHQNRYSGNNIKTDYYEVNYSYKLADRMYSGSQKISNSTANNNYLENLLSSKSKKVSIKVSNSNFAESQLRIGD